MAGGIGGTLPPPFSGNGGGSTYVVVGTITSPNSAGVGGLEVVVVDKNVGPDVILVTTRTNARGSYQASFSADLVLKQRKQQPDLQARAYAGEFFLAASDVHYNASPYEILNINLPANARWLPSEHEILTGALSGHYAGKLGDLQENAERQDITYLANKTGWDARTVALAALADQFSQRTSATGAAGTAIHPAFFYALFRAGLPTNEDALYAADNVTLAAIWQSAAEQGILPRQLAQTIPQVTAQFQNISAQKRLSGPALTGVSALNEMLSVSRLNSAQQQEFAQLYTAYQTDMPAFWQAVTKNFGQAIANRLQVDGKLAFLTINNAPLMQVLRSIGGANGLNDPVQLAHAGYFRGQSWSRLLSSNIPIPAEIPGEGETQRANYADYLAAHIRLSYPTAAIAYMVGAKELPVSVPEQVQAFLTEHQGKFEIGVQPIQQYIADNKLQVASATVDQIKLLQRVYQLTPSDQAMAGLLKHGLGAAYHIVRYDKGAFVESFQKELGGTEATAQVYDRAVQIHNAVLNITMSYLTAKNGLALGASPIHIGTIEGSVLGQILQPAPNPAANAGDVIAYPTLEGLFGSMDFCACDECRSVLSPAAYLVDLLLFLDRAPLNKGQPNPLTVLLERRPDVQHLPLTCENTNTALPYIDVVNETLEYFVANTVQQLSLNGYQGHDTDGMASADLLASPQFVLNAAYTLLQGERFPLPLPFHQPLENLRRHFNKFGNPLPLAMERLRNSDDLERGANPYGWRDILMEQLLLAREEYEILTDSAAVPLWRMYGFPSGTADASVIAALSNAEQFARRMSISYDDLVALLQTRFINPNSDLIPKLARLDVPFATLKALKDGTVTDAAFDALLPTGTQAPDPAEYGGDIKAWVRKDANYARIMALITLTNPAGASDSCNFDQLEFRYSQPVASANDTSTRLGAVEFTRFLRFIRLWQKLGWTIEQTDAVLCALYRADLAPLSAGDIDTLTKLDTGFLTLLPRLGILARVMDALNLPVRIELMPLLATWSDLGTYGSNALYRRMFLNPALLKQDAVFADNGYGEFLVDPTQKLADHSTALRSAFNLTGDEFGQITAALNYDANTALTIPNISAIYRRGYLARKLRLSVREFLLLTSLTGLDPFAAPDPTNPAILRLLALVQALKDRSLKTAVALYLIWNQDLSGKSAPDPTQITELARTLRGDYASIEDQFAVVADPGGDISRARMTLVYGEVAADAFFALLDDTLALDTPYTHPTPTMEPAITAVDSKLAYDDFHQLLSHTGLLSATTRDALKLVPGVTVAFQQAVDQLYASSEDAKGSFFTRYPELLPLYTAYILSPDPPDKKRSALLAAFQPQLSRLRKQQQALQRLSAATNSDLTLVQALLNPPGGALYPLHAAGHADQPALNDVLALETPGLAMEIFYRATATGTVDLSIPASANLDYASGSANPLPTNPTPGSVISGIWHGAIETPEAGYYNLIIEADAGAQVTLSFDGQAEALVQNGTIWRNSGSLNLQAGKLYAIILTVEQVKDRLSVKWETPKRPREVIPGRYLYPPTLLAPFSDVYTRFLKAASLAVALGLTANELAYFATSADYQIAGDGWLNALPVSGDPSATIAAALLKPLLALLDFARLKAGISPGDEQLLTILTDPATATAQTESLLYTLTHWDADSLNALLAEFGGTIAGLAHLDLFSRVYDAFALLQPMGIVASALLKATTNAPDSDIVGAFQAALRARYSIDDWREVIQPINDEMRDLQRNALVAYILHQLRSNPATAHIDTADKLFEYFLMDVEMEPCMQTSRIRHALSSVQLFIERCLMNLEPRVSPSSINADQWAWMKRYRVWEANRKVFLFPENWLEPELRDDKSPIFKEIESELLQSDITNDTATSALLTYLSKLQEIAKLEPCGIYHIPADPNTRRGEVNHIIGRTSGAHRKYYYRRYEYGYWTPWEQIKLDIEDNPVLPVVWNSRLLLFWLRIVTQTPTDPQTLQTSTNNQDHLADLHPADIQGDAKSNAQSNMKVTVQAVLCWSEYYNGAWQAVKTSDAHRPAELGKFSPAGNGAFKRSDLQLSVSQEDDALRINIGGTGYGNSFWMYNTHSLPMLAEDLPPHLLILHIPEYARTLTQVKQRFTIDYDHFLHGTLTRDILGDPLPFNTVETHHPLPDIWDAPFFFEDSRNVFYVTTQEQQVSVINFPGYGAVFNPGHLQAAELPPLVIKQDPNLLGTPRTLGNGGRVNPDPGVIDPVAMQNFVSEDAYIRQGIGNSSSIAYGNVQIGPAGALANSNAERLG